MLGLTIPQVFANPHFEQIGRIGFSRRIGRQRWLRGLAIGIENSCREEHATRTRAASNAITSSKMLFRLVSSDWAVGITITEAEEEAIE